MGVLAEKLNCKLIKDKEIKSHLRVRSSPFVFETVDKRLQSDYDRAEWSVHKTNKKSVVLKKQKLHHVMFEDRVQATLAKMGFTTLNNKGLRLPSVDDEAIPGKQIDVFAADNVTIVVVDGGYFSNSIIINIDTKKDDPLNFDKINSPLRDSNITEPVI